MSDQPIDVWQPVTDGRDFPVIATNGSGEFIRADRASIWYRCDSNGQPIEHPMPGLLKFRIPTRNGIMMTMLFIPDIVWVMPGLGVAYRKIRTVWEFPDGRSGEFLVQDEPCLAASPLVKDAKRRWEGVAEQQS